MKKKLLFLSVTALFLAGCKLGPDIDEPDTPSSDEIPGLTLVDHVYYRVNDNYAEVMMFQDVESIVIKSSITVNSEPIPVTTISDKEYIDDSTHLRTYSHITSLVVPEGITTINKHGLGGLTALKSLTLPNSLTYLDQGALYRTALEEIHLPSFGSDYGYMEENNHLDDLDFNYEIFDSPLTDWINDHYDANIMSLSLAFYDPNENFSILDHPTYTFSGIPEVKKIYITGGSYLFPYAFYGMPLEELHLSSSLVGAFGENGVYSSFDAYFENMNHYLAMNYDSKYASIPYNAETIYIANEVVKDLVIPEGVVEIKPYTFYNFRDFTSITLPNSLEKVGYETFRSYGNAKSNYYQNGFYYGNSENPYLFLAYTSSNIDFFTFHEDCQVFMNSSFKNTIEYVDVVYINEKIKHIPSCAFSIDESFNRNQLVAINYTGENNIETIGDRAFYYTSVTSFTFGSHIRYIGKEAFAYNDQLLRLNWPDKVDGLVIKELAFVCDSKFNNEIVLPSGTVSVGYEAFPLNITRSSFIYIPESLTDYKDFEFDYEDGIFQIYREDNKLLVDPYVIFESTYGEYSDMFSSLLSTYSSISLDYIQNISYANGCLFKQNVDSVIFYGFARKCPSYASLVTIPDEIIGLPVTSVTIYSQDTYLVSTNKLVLNSNCKSLKLTTYMPTNIVAPKGLTNINNSSSGSKAFKLFSLASEEEFQVEDVPSKVTVYYYSETENYDGHHWRYVNSQPSVWVNI